MSYSMIETPNWWKPVKGKQTLISLSHDRLLSTPLTRMGTVSCRRGRWSWPSGGAPWRTSTRSPTTSTMPITTSTMSPTFSHRQSSSNLPFDNNRILSTYPLYRLSSYSMRTTMINWTSVSSRAFANEYLWFPIIFWKGQQICWQSQICKRNDHFVIFLYFIWINK